MCSRRQNTLWNIEYRQVFERKGCVRRASTSWGEPSIHVNLDPYLSLSAVRRAASPLSATFVLHHNYYGSGMYLSARRNCIVNAVVKNKQMVLARNERLGKAKKRKTRKEIIAAMDLQVQSLRSPRKKNERDKATAAG